MAPVPHTFILIIVVLITFQNTTMCLHCIVGIGTMQEYFPFHYGIPLFQDHSYLTLFRHGFGKAQPCRLLCPPNFKWKSRFHLVSSTFLLHSGGERPTWKPTLKVPKSVYFFSGRHLLRRMIYDLFACNYWGAYMFLHLAPIVLFH